MAGEHPVDQETSRPPHGLRPGGGHETGAVLVPEEAGRLASWVTPTHGQVRVVVTG